MLPIPGKGAMVPGISGTGPEKKVLDGLSSAFKDLVDPVPSTECRDTRVFLVADPRKWTPC